MIYKTVKEYMNTLNFIPNRLKEVNDFIEMEYYHILKTKKGIVKIHKDIFHNRYLKTIKRLLNNKH